MSHKSLFLFILIGIIVSIDLNQSAKAILKKETFSKFFRQSKIQENSLSQILPGDLIKILSPIENEKLTTPVKVNISIEKSLKLPIISATLNGRDVSNSFKINNNFATASLEEKDGIVIGNNNELKVVLKILGVPAAQVIRHFFVESSGTSIIPPQGGQVNLPSVGKITFPSGSFPTSQFVSLKATKIADTDDDFKTTSAIFGAQSRLPYELRVNSGSRLPEKSFKASIVVPNSFLSQVPSNSEIQVLAGILQNGGEDVFYSFELFPSKFLVTSKTVEVELPPAAFTNLLSSDKTYEAVILLTTTPTKNTKLFLSRLSSVSPKEKVLSRPQDAIRNTSSGKESLPKATCQGATLGQPLNGTLTVTGKFNPAAKSPNHFGTDYKAANRTPTLSMADGTVERVDYQVKTLPRPDPRTGKKARGWGQYIVIKHTDGSHTLYAHLQRDGVKVKKGQSVKKGDVIALSDSSGIGSGPHLHVEYAPNGSIFSKASKVDPEPCIGQNVKGSITVRDNGPAADDAFEVKLNGVSICKTAIGASNTCGIGSLRPGTATLSITAIIAPDNVGTYEIKLSDGLTFSDGTTIRSSTLPQGGTDTFIIKIPSK